MDDDIVARNEELVNFADRINPMDDPTYVKILNKLQASHVELAKLDRDDPNPVEMQRIMGDLRIEVNRLFIYMNQYIDTMIEMSEEYSGNREKLYISQLSTGKTPSAADKHAGEMTRVQNNAVAITKLRLEQIKNNYNRYDGLAIYLASRLKGINTERIMG